MTGLIVIGAGTPLWAGIDLPAFKSCIAAAIDDNQPASDCVHAAHGECLTYAPGEQSASATLCFVQAKDAWSVGIKSRLDEISASSEDTITAIAGIEAKYDVLANLLQCERMLELARLTETPGSEVALQNARCEATATGLALAKLLVQSRNLN